MTKGHRAKSEWAVGQPALLLFTTAVVPALVPELPTQRPTQLCPTSSSPYPPSGMGSDTVSGQTRMEGEGLAFLGEVLVPAAAARMDPQRLTVQIYGECPWVR